MSAFAFCQKKDLAEIKFPGFLRMESIIQKFQVYLFLFSIS